MSVLSPDLTTFCLAQCPTAMEPEIGFLMANLARIGPGSKVLDPFTGCCSLLLSAAFLQRIKPNSSSKSANQLLRGQLNDGHESSVPGSLTSSSVTGRADTDDAPCTSTRDRVRDMGCLVGVDACMGSDVRLIHSNFLAVGLGSALPSLTLRWEFAESLLEVHTTLYSLHNVPAIV
jgi:hypothetical protein